MVDFEKKDKYNFDDLLRIMEILRAPDGCMWDREQDHQSIRRNFIEETYEVCEAIDEQDTEHLKEELGDVLLQVVFHTQMEKEKGVFDIGDVADGICKKLIYRHPHIFGSVEVGSSEEILRNWDELKRKEKHQETDTSALESVAKSLPGLIRAEKLQKKAAKVGFDWPDMDGALSKVQEELQELFPQTPVLRMDADTVTASRSHEVILEEFRRNNVPILVGTQMVAKGLDFENVTLVGVILADQSLFVDDFRAGERTFSLLTQVVGRAGRGERLGRAVIQTFTPDNDVIQCAARQDYDAFYEGEIALRRLRDYPPFSDLILLTASGADEEAVLRCCARLRRALEEALPRLSGPWRLLGPAPAAVARVNNRYRYRLTLSAKNTKQLRALLSGLLRAASQDKENRGVSVYGDIDPYNS